MLGWLVIHPCRLPHGTKPKHRLSLTRGMGRFFWDSPTVHASAPNRRPRGVRNSRPHQRASLGSVAASIAIGPRRALVLPVPAPSA